MTDTEIWVTRYAAGRQAPLACRGLHLSPARWADAPHRLAGTDRAEIRVRSAALDGLPPHAMVAAVRLRDAGFGLALYGAGRPEQLRWLRALPWSAVVAHPALCGHAAGVRMVDGWADATGRMGLPFVAPLRDLSALAGLGAAGFTHGEIAGPPPPGC